MARDIGFGQYLDTESPIHALDARTKVVGALATMISLFCIHTPAQLILGLAFIVAVTLIARIGIKRALAATSYVLVMITIGHTTRRVRPHPHHRRRRHGRRPL